MAKLAHVVLTSENASSFERTVTFLEMEEYLLINFMTCMRPLITDPPTGFALQIEGSGTLSSSYVLVSLLDRHFT